MKQEITSNGITRRSFMKKSTVAAVAVANLTIFSGLVNAQISSGGFNYGTKCAKGSGITFCHTQGTIQTCPGVLICNGNGQVIRTCLITCHPDGTQTCV